MEAEELFNIKKKKKTVQKLQKEATNRCAK